MDGGEASARSAIGVELHEMRVVHGAQVVDVLCVRVDEERVVRRHGYSGYPNVAAVDEEDKVVWRRRQ